MYSDCRRIIIYRPCVYRHKFSMSLSLSHVLASPLQYFPPKSGSCNMSLISTLLHVVAPFSSVTGYLLLNGCNVCFLNETFLMPWVGLILHCMYCLHGDTRQDTTIPTMSSQDTTIQAPSSQNKTIPTTSSQDTTIQAPSSQDKTIPTTSLQDTAIQAPSSQDDAIRKTSSQHIMIRAPSSQRKTLLSARLQEVTLRWSLRRKPDYCQEMRSTVNRDQVTETAYNIVHVMLDVTRKLEIIIRYILL
jgi:hypothetical protein